MIDDNFIKSTFITQNGKINSNYNKKFTNEIREYLLNRYPDTLSEMESIVRILLNIDTHPVCQICGKPVIFYRSVVKPFGKTCSTSCSAKIASLSVDIVKRNKAIKKSVKEKYGVDNVFQLESVKQKSKMTKKETYNDENYNNREKERQTKIDHYGGPSYFSNDYLKNKSINKKKKTVKEKYDVDNVFQTNEVKEKIKKSLLIHYGVDNYAKTEEWKKQYINTSLQKYGYENPMMSKEVQDKSYATKLKNKTINSSSTEDKSYDILVQIFGKDDIIRQYKTIEYPFRCDLYIKSLKLYIECQYGWLHHKFPFDPNNKECINKLNEWKLKSINHPMYTAAIKTWTIFDVKKRNIAKENNLNYLEFFSYENFITWINNIKKSSTY